MSPHSTGTGTLQGNSLCFPLYQSPSIHQCLEKLPLRLPDHLLRVSAIQKSSSRGLTWVIATRLLRNLGCVEFFLAVYAARVPRNQSLRSLGGDWLGWCLDSCPPRTSFVGPFDNLNVETNHTAIRIILQCIIATLELEMLGEISPHFLSIDLKLIIVVDIHLLCRLRALCS